MENSIYVYTIGVSPLRIDANHIANLEAWLRIINFRHIIAFIQGIFTIPEFNSQPLQTFIYSLVSLSLRISRNLDMLPPVIKKQLF